MAGARQRQRRARRRQSGLRSRAPRRPPDARECVQLERKEEVRCSNCDETHVLIRSRDGNLYERWTTTPDKISKPRLVKELGNHDIVQIACGDHHSVALSRGGNLFTWGQNTHGQLGLGSQDLLIPVPHLVKELKGIPLAQIAAGGAHSFVVSFSGAVYSWGKNDFGQLGLGHTEDRDCPSYVEALEHWKAVFISCGADHTAVLSKDGLLYTFGAGGAGQLGHNSTRNELTPRVVAELWGARVSQVACGRQHTLVYVLSLDQVYSFGSYEGQLGSERKANQLIPLPINSPGDNGKFSQENMSQNVIKTTAEGKESIVGLLFKKRNSYPLNGIATLERKEVNAWVSNSCPQHRETIKKNIRLIFSSEACINGSFLDERGKHFRTSKEISGLDMAKVLCFYKKMSKNAEVYQEVQKEINNLLPSLSSSPISPENFRIYLILPFLLQREVNSSYCTLKLLAEAILRLQQKDLQTLECLWSNLETDLFKKLVIIFKRVSLYALTELFRSGLSEQFPQEIETLQILQILYQVNSRAGFRLQDDNFYIPEMNEIVLHFFTMGKITMLIKYPCIFDMKQKMLIHTLECNRLSLYFNFHPDSVSVLQNQWTFPVRRECLLHDIWNHLRNAKNKQFTCSLKVVFTGEEGEGVGLRREFFSVAAKALCDPQSGVFRHFPSRLVWFPRQALSHGDTFLLAGTLFGMALYNHCLAPFPFPRALFKKMRDVEPTLEDLEELIPAVGRNLKNILKEESEDKLESLQMTFVNVTYIYYKESHQTIRNFWTVFLKLPEEKKKKFLAFLSGSDLIIPYGLEYFQFSIEDPLCENPDDAYPSAYTCNCTLFLPRYSSKEILEEKLLSAIEYSEGFGLM
ncbi:probable E3 ubiquitin-protein ligase HERC4 isoform X2 [Numida meleagris]|uniref:probable E3 ubiquitin-protein ligase HERC4 isoform X2 n=1 Tax=Numida meleagris TaxID=8996 RepID=UPI000B3DFF6E|nr:probable E3 ubiquitin-protein ligase HERC4 isoform X2 [Numida meleagris]